MLPDAAVPPPSLPAVGTERISADRPVRWRRCLGLAALAPAGWLLQLLAAQSPERTEAIYSRGIYPYIEATLTRVASWSPIAIGETLLLLGLAVLALRLGRGVAAWWRGRRRLRNLAAHALLQTAAGFGVLFLLFQLLWGINHARLPFAVQVSLQPGAVEPTRLARVVMLLAQRAAAVRPPETDPEAPYLASTWLLAVGDAYAAAGQQWPALAGPRPVLRAAWISRVMTLGSISGIYSPFTGEPNVNVHVPEKMRPFVACHEVAHLRGYAREDEANFIAWWVGSRSPDRTIAYSCELMACRYAMQALLEANRTTWEKVRTTVPREVMRDDVAIDRFWDGQPKMATRLLSAVTTATNDLYLKSSGHREGVRSYGRMVDLLIAALDP